MKFKITFVPICIFVLFLVSGCIGAESNRNLLKLETVTQAIQGTGVKLTSIGQINEPFVVLNKIQPYGYWIGNNANDDKMVNLNIYVFKSENERTDALNIFNEHLQMAKLTTYPNVYEKKNVMVIYFSESEAVRPFDYQLKKAIQNL